MVKVRKRKGQPTVPPLRWGERSQLLDRSVPTPPCAYPGCQRKAVRLPSPENRPDLYRVHTYCHWHRPDAQGKRPSDTRPVPPFTLGRGRPGSVDAPLCVIPGCHRVREVIGRPVPDQPALRWVVCAYHRRWGGGVNGWRAMVSPADYARIDAEVKEVRTAHDALVRARHEDIKQRAAAILAERQAYYARVGVKPPRTASGFSPGGFWQSMPEVTQQYVGKCWNTARLRPRELLRALQLCMDEFKMLTTTFTKQKYKGKDTNIPMADYAPTEDEWREIFEYLDESGAFKMVY